MDDITFRPIGVVHSPFATAEGMPIQPSGDAAATGTVELLPAYGDGLADLEGFSHIILLYHFHRVQEAKLTVTPFLDDEARGVFATRAPVRPNPIGLSVLQLLRREENVLYVANLDVLDGTPVLDVKPYVPAFDRADATRLGWLEGRETAVKEKSADRRFT